MRYLSHTYRLVIAATLLSFALPVAANDQVDWRSWPLGDPFILTFGAFFANIDTRVGARSASEPVSSKVDFESDLGLADSKVSPIGGFAWRFAKRHRLGVNYFKLDRDGGTISRVPINIGDVMIEAGVPVQSFFNVAVLEVAYNYSLVFTEHVDWSVGLGFSLQDIDAGVRAVDGGIIESQDLSVAVPLPTLNTGLAYAFNEKWIGLLNLGWLAVETDLSDTTDFKGSIWNGSAGLRYKAFKHLGFDFGWSYFSVDVNYDKRDLRSVLDYDYHGPILALEWVF